MNGTRRFRPGLSVLLVAAEALDDARVRLRDDPDRAEDHDEHEDRDDDDQDDHEDLSDEAAEVIHRASPFVCGAVTAVAGTTSTVAPSTAATTTRSPASSSAPAATSRGARSRSRRCRASPGRRPSTNASTARARRGRRARRRWSGVGIARDAGACSSSGLIVKSSSTESTAAVRICSHQGPPSRFDAEPADERSGREHQEREIERQQLDDEEDEDEHQPSDPHVLRRWSGTSSPSPPSSLLDANPNTGADEPRLIGSNSARTTPSGAPIHQEPPPCPSLSPPTR